MSTKQQKHDFIICGLEISISKEKAEHRLCTIKHREEPRKYYVLHKGREYAIKQALEALDDRLMRADYGPKEALRVFRRLGFTVGQR